MKSAYELAMERLNKTGANGQIERRPEKRPGRAGFQVHPVAKIAAREIASVKEEIA